MFYKKNYYLILTNVFFIGLILFGLINSDFLYKYFVGGSEILFGDYKAAVEAIICNQKEINKACPEYAYGKILTLLPYSNDVSFVYYKLIPYLLICSFIFFVCYYFDAKKKLNIFILYLCVLSPSTLLLIERLNLDIIILISIFILSLNKIYFINWIILINLTLLKIYPFILSLIIFYENKKRSFYVSLIIFIIISLLIILLIIKFDLFETINAYGTESKAGYFYLFSFNHLPKLLKYSLGINYILSLSLLGFSFIYIVYKMCSKSDITVDVRENNNELIMFNLGAVTLIISYLIYSNYYYREVFLICVFPILLKDEIFKIRFIKYFLYFSIFRYLFEYIYSYISLTDFIYYIDNLRYFKFSFTLVSYLKSLFDLALITGLSYILFILNKNFIIEKLPFLHKLYQR